MLDSTIELNEGNLYTNKGRIIQINNEESELTREPFSWVASNEDTYHTVKSGDIVNLIAFEYYSRFTDNAQDYWWVICDANKIQNPLDLGSLIGTRILIPNILNVKLKIRQEND